MAVPFRTPEELVDATGDHEALGRRWNGPARHLDADNMPFPPTKFHEPEPMRGDLLAIKIGAGAGLIVSIYLWAYPTCLLWLAELLG